VAEEEGKGRREGKGIAERAPRGRVRGAREAVLELSREKACEETNVRL
jgi:hypothetical protein